MAIALQLIVLQRWSFDSNELFFYSLKLKEMIMYGLTDFFPVGATFTNHDAFMLRGLSV